MRFPGFGGKKPAPVAALPEIPEPAVAPVPDDLAVNTTKRREYSAIRQRSGRLSTINTAPRPVDTVLG